MVVLSRKKIERLGDVETINALINANVSRTQQECQTEVQLLDSSLRLFAEGFDLCSPNNEENEQRIARMGLVSQNFNSLAAAVKIAEFGFYLQSLGLLKNVYENWLAFWYLAKFPREAKKWLIPQKHGKPPKAERMRNEIDHPSIETKLKVKQFYSELNKFAHTDPIAVLDRFVQGNKGPGIKVGVEFRKNNFEACAYALLLWIGNMNDAISSWISPQDDWHKKNSLQMTKIVDYLDIFNKKYESTTNVNK